MFAVLMEAVITHSVGQVRHFLYAVDGDYRRILQAPPRNRRAMATLSARAKVDFFEEMVAFAVRFGARDRLEGRRVVGEHNAACNPDYGDR